MKFYSLPEVMRLLSLEEDSDPRLATIPFISTMRGKWVVKESLETWAAANNLSPIDYSRLNNNLTQQYINLTDLAKLKGIKYHTLMNLHKRGLTPEVVRKAGCNTLFCLADAYAWVPKAPGRERKVSRAT